MPNNWQFKGPFTQEQYARIQGNPLMLLDSSNTNSGYEYPSKYGIRSRFPRSTPKYARYITRLNHEFVDTTARMYISVVSPQAFLQDIDPALQGIARVLVGSGKKADQGGRGYIDFLLQQANHALNEKYQVIETLSDNYVAFFFGQSAPIFQYGGSLMNTFQDDWTINMLRLYQSMGRGSQLARRGVLFYLKYDSMIVSGSLLNLNTSLTGDVEIVSPFSFNLLVRKIHYIYGGLEPSTDIMTDTTVKGLPPALSAFDPTGEIYKIAQEKLQGRVDDDMGATTPMGSGMQTQVNQTPPEEATVPEAPAAALPSPTLTQTTVAPMDEAVAQFGSMGAEGGMMGF